MVMMVGFLDFCSIWPMGGPKVGQRTPTGLTKLLPTRPANSETFCFLAFSEPKSACLARIGPCQSLSALYWAAGGPFGQIRLHIGAYEIWHLPKPPMRSENGPGANPKEPK